MNPQSISIHFFILSIWVTTATTSPQSHNLEPEHPPGFTENFVAQTCLIARKRNSALDISTSSQNLVTGESLSLKRRQEVLTLYIYIILCSSRHQTESSQLVLWQVKAIAELGRLEQEFQKTEQVAMDGILET